MFKSVDPKVSFPEMEEEVLAFWKDQDIFKKSISQREGKEEFVFYDGPPFATGLPHFGHFVPGTIKDIIPRYKTMKGYQVSRRFGWDCHGLPVENLIEKELGLNSKTDIEAFGIAKFNEACRSSVLRYVDEWRRIVTRLGRWVDFDNDYKTMDVDYMESIWWVMKQLWDKGLLYEGAYILPYCPRCSTVLSNHELALGGYKDVHDPAITVRFKSKDEANTYFVAWTTTPWTLPSNLALAVGPEIDYVKIKDGSDFYIMAQARLGAYYKEAEKLEIVWTKKGSELKGLSYEPLFPYFADLSEKNAFKVYTADYVTTDDGAGIVHIAPGFGEDDYNVLRGTGVPTVCPIDAECKFTTEVSDYTGRFVKDCDKDIIERLKNEGKLVKREQYLHAYPHCWRCSSPLIYRGVSSWFVKIDSVKPKMLSANSKIYWVPGHIKEGRFGKWLENARDWAISRNRYWGNPLPIWKCDTCTASECIGSRADLEKKSGTQVTDLHKHFVDDLTWKCSCGGTMKRIPEVLDCWFESGAMPYAQNHYPFENKAHFESHYPADFIAEGLDQTRGWFYTLTVLAAALFDRPAFKNCIVNGLVLAEDGKKMSKSLRNYTDPMNVINQFGSDALRVFLMHSSVVKADDLKYSDDGVKDVLKSMIIPLWNSYSFFVTYANIDKISVTEAPVNAANPLDRWILSLCENMVLSVSNALEAYDMAKAIDPIVNFVDLLNNWYIRRSRRRFWRSGADADKSDAYNTLHRVLVRLAMTAAPVIPFTSEAIYRNLKAQDQAESVHLCDYPEYDERFRDEELEWKMDAIRRAVSMGRALRYQFNLKIRQPLKAIHLVTRDKKERAVLLEMKDILEEELNVKEVLFRDNEEELVEYKAKANFKILGKELGKEMKAAAERIELLTGKEIASMLEGSVLEMEVSGIRFQLNKDKLDIRRIEKENLRVINEGSLTVALDTELTPELQAEGDVRDLVRGVQNLRKESGFDVTDRIALSISGPESFKAAFELFRDFISGETLASSIEWKSVNGMQEIEAGDEKWLAKATKI